jgi:hypothetical protein
LRRSPTKLLLALLLLWRPSKSSLLCLLLLWRENQTL